MGTIKAYNSFMSVYSAGAFDIYGHNWSVTFERSNVTIPEASGSITIGGNYNGLAYVYFNGTVDCFLVTTDYCPTGDTITKETYASTSYAGDLSWFTLNGSTTCVDRSDVSGMAGQYLTNFTGTVVCTQSGSSKKYNLGLNKWNRDGLGHKYFLFYTGSQVKSYLAVNPGFALYKSQYLRSSVGL